MSIENNQYLRTGESEVAQGARKVSAMRKTRGESPKPPHLRDIAPEDLRVRYMRSIPEHGFEYQIPKPLALYLLDGKDKHERLQASTRQNPVTSYSGISRIWREDA